MLLHLGKSEQCFVDKQRDNEFTSPVQTAITALSREWRAAVTAVLGGGLLTAIRKSQCSPKEVNKHKDKEVTLAETILLSGYLCGM